MGVTTTDHDREPFNMLTLVAHQVLFRVAWIFKTESVIMPAFLDSITSAGWVRGMLPPLNRFGQSVVPLLLSERLSRTSHKATWLSQTTFLMSLPFLVLGVMQRLVGTQPPWWFVAMFLVAYVTFFSLHGVNQAAYNTIQGKLIRPHHRGRLIILAGYLGTPLAVLAAWLLLRPWTQSQPPDFSAIFLFTGFAFLLASLASRRLKETPDPVVSRNAINVRRRFSEAWFCLKHDRHLRHIAMFSALAVCSQLLFPHYQRLGREQPGYEGGMLMVWVIVQHLAVAVFSWISGRLADRLGNRSALRWLSFGSIFAPLLPLVLNAAGAANWYWLTFAALGLVPVTFRMQLNYVLELTDRSRHPIYVSTVVLCMAIPIILSPLVGDLVHRIGYVVPFCGIALILVAAWTLTLTMVEPRSPEFERRDQPQTASPG
ncbi:MAG: MFS transporter [Planctomycetaceae bacterium]